MIDRYVLDSNKMTLEIIPEKYKDRNFPRGFTSSKSSKTIKLILTLFSITLTKSALKVFNTNFMKFWYHIFLKVINENKRSIKIQNNKRSAL